MSVAGVWPGTGECSNSRGAGPLLRRKGLGSQKWGCRWAYHVSLRSSPPAELRTLPAQSHGEMHGQSAPVAVLC